MLRSVLSELFPNLLKREVVREHSSGSLTALQSLQRRIDMANKTKSPVKTPPPRSTKADPDRKDADGEPKKPPPVRDVREDPAPNPDGEDD